MTWCCDVWYLGTPNFTASTYFTGGVIPGDHGYSDVSLNYESEGANPDMRSIFMAKGPAFQSGGVVLPWIKQVDQYLLFAKTLGIEPRPNNGTWERVKDFLKAGAASRIPGNTIM